jgi:hypothetical protein
MPVVANPIPALNITDSRAALVPRFDGLPLFLAPKASGIEYSLIDAFSDQSTTQNVTIPIIPLVGAAWATVDITKRTTVVSNNTSPPTISQLDTLETWIVGFGGQTATGVSDTLTLINAATGSCQQFRKPTASGVNMPWPEGRKFATLTGLPKAPIPEEPVDPKDKARVAAAAAAAKKEAAKPAATAATKELKTSGRASSASTSALMGNAPPEVTVSYLPVPIILYGGVDASGYLREDVTSLYFEPLHIAAVLTTAQTASGNTQAEAAPALRPVSPSNAKLPTPASAAATDLVGNKPIWSRVGASNPGPRAFHAACAVSGGNKLLVIGGVVAPPLQPAALASPTGPAATPASPVAATLRRVPLAEGTLEADAWLLDSTAGWTWSSLNSVGDCPCPRAQHSVSSLIVAESGFDVRPYIPAYHRMAAKAGDGADPSKSSAPTEVVFVTGGVCHRQEHKLSLELPGEESASDEIGLAPALPESVFDGLLYMLVFDEKATAFVEAEAASRVSREHAPPSATGATPRSGRVSASGTKPAATTTGKGKGKDGKVEPEVKKVPAFWACLDVGAEDPTTERLLQRSGHTTLARVRKVRVANEDGKEDEFGIMSLFLAGGISSEIIEHSEQRAGMKNEIPPVQAAVLELAPDIPVASPSEASLHQTTDFVATYDADGSLILRRGEAGEPDLVSRTYPDGAFEGESLNGIRHGSGQMKYSDGRVYTGEWRNDQWCGQGDLIYVDGRQYVGGFAGGMFHGTGTMGWPPVEAEPKRHIAREFTKLTAVIAVGSWLLRKYEGQWKHGLPHGLAQAEFQNGCTYQGHFAEGFVHGDGKVVVDAPDIDTLVTVEGQFHRGQLSGPHCTFRFATSTTQETYQGGFLDGQRTGSTVVDYRDGAHFEGMYRCGRMNGSGLLRMADQTVYDGKFVADQRCGYGTCVFPNGDIYSGLWLKDKMHGEGTLRRKSGHETRGVWSHGVLLRVVSEA